MTSLLVETKSTKRGGGMPAGEEDRGTTGERGPSEPRAVPLAAVSVGYSPREMMVDADHVASLAEVLDRLPPVVIDGLTMTVIDGVHRVEAFRKAGRSHIEARVFQGNRTEALVLAIAANVRHGKPLSRSERQAAARVLLGECPERSDRWVAEVCGLSHSTVALLRRASSNAPAQVRTGRDGRRRPVARSTSASTHAPSARMCPTVAGPDRPLLDDPALATPQGEAAARWLAQTSVTTEDLHTYLGSLPLSRTYEVVDECRRRARAWAEIADALEARTRRR